MENYTCELPIFIPKGFRFQTKWREKVMTKLTGDLYVASVRIFRNVYYSNLWLVTFLFYFALQRFSIITIVFFYFSFCENLLYIHQYACSILSLNLRSKTIFKKACAAKLNFKILNLKWNSTYFIFID